ncbi:MAG: D-cysteine desulfhydrase family protein [Chloroflexota bacterium]|nr:MAG: D-cysteine desulfhydrase family protein [Chloroflexota bacterium]
MGLVKPNFPDRANLAHLPTRIERMDRLSSHLGGPQLLVKRDDQTGLALGGNKVRKLEFLVADAMAQGKDHLITTGGPQSNHCRQTAAAAAQNGLGCSLVLRGQAPQELGGNLLLDRLLGSELCWAGDRPPEKVMAETAEALEAAGRRPYIVLKGGSNAVGATGYVLAMKEAIDQLAEAEESVDVMVVASSSAGTQAGMVLGAHVYGFRGRILGISIDVPELELKALVTDLAESTAEFLGLDRPSLVDRVEVNADYLGGGYGVLGDLERGAIDLVGRLEGIALDPVYTGRAMGGLLDLIARGMFQPSERILFWHTGGAPALFAYGENLFL